MSFDLQAALPRFKQLEAQDDEKCNLLNNMLKLYGTADGVHVLNENRTAQLLSVASTLTGSRDVKAKIASLMVLLAGGDDQLFHDIISGCLCSSWMSTNIHDFLASLESLKTILLGSPKLQLSITNCSVLFEKSSYFLSSSLASSSSSPSTSSSSSVSFSLTVPSPSAIPSITLSETNAKEQVLKYISEIVRNGVMNEAAELVGMYFKFQRMGIRNGMVYIFMRNLQVFHKSLNELGNLEDNILGELAINIRDKLNEGTFFSRILFPPLKPNDDPEGSDTDGSTKTEKFTSKQIAKMLERKRKSRSVSKSPVLESKEEELKKQIETLNKTIEDMKKKKK